MWFEDFEIIEKSELKSVNSAFIVKTFSDYLGHLMEINETGTQVNIKKSSPVGCACDLGYCLSLAINHRVGESRRDKVLANLSSVVLVITISQRANDFLKQLTVNIE